MQSPLSAVGIKDDRSRNVEACGPSTSACQGSRLLGSNRVTQESRSATQRQSRSGRERSLSCVNTNCELWCDERANEETDHALIARRLPYQT